MVKAAVTKYMKVNINDPCDVFECTKEKSKNANQNDLNKLTKGKIKNTISNGTMKVDNLVINVGNPDPNKKSPDRPTSHIEVFIFPTFLMMIALILTVFYAGLTRVLSDSSEGTSVLVYDGKHKSVMWPNPPPRDNYAAVARYVMHISEWGSLATNSTHKGIEGYPFNNVFSVSDGPFSNSTGVPYLYLTPMELSVIDIEATNKVSLTVTEAQSDFCNKKGFDPEDPRCAHIILTGSIQKIKKDSEEEKFAKIALFSRHVEMKNWPSGHDWFFAKLDIVHIYLLDYFGGVATVTPKDYFAAIPFGDK